MKLNLKFYQNETKEILNEKDKKIIEYINKYSPESYEKIFEDDSDIDIVLAFSSIRHNILNWYELDKDSLCLEIRGKFWRDYRRTMYEN